MSTYYTMTQAQAFESEKNRKAFLYTCIICGTILLLFIIIKWTVEPVSVPIVQDLIEINLGNNEEGFGEEQPLIKGHKTPSRDEVVASRQNAASTPDEKIQPDDNPEDNAAPVVKPTKTNIKTKSVTPVETPVTKPQKPKITYNGPGSGPTGNNPTDDNGYKYQGNNPNGKGDAGDPNGNKDSYGNTPGGRIGGPKVIGNRKIIKYYSFEGDLPKAVINAIVKVTPAGKGSFIGFGKGSTTRDSRYASEINRYLNNIAFDKSENESTVTVIFNFNEN